MQIKNSDQKPYNLPDSRNTLRRCTDNNVFAAYFHSFVNACSGKPTIIRNILRQFAYITLTGKYPIILGHTQLDTVRHCIMLCTRHFESRQPTIFSPQNYDRFLSFTMAGKLHVILLANFHCTPIFRGDYIYTFIKASFGSNRQK